jgi:two-component system, sensor histidine kinase and response regulator
MENNLRILIVEDLESDAEIVKRVLSHEGIKFEDLIVETKDDFVMALSGFKPDLIISDYSMPQFTGMKALLIRQELAPNVPFVLVTGSMNEDVAVECMKAGADDYVIKQNLIRLIPAINAAMQKQETLRLQREAEYALRKSEDRFKQIAEAAGEFIWEVDATGLYTYVNRISESLLGYSAEEILGKKHFYDFFEPGVKEELKLIALEAFSQKETFRDFENPNQHKDGHIVILSTTGMPILDPDGNLLGYRGVDTDITERKRAEEALRESEKKFRNLYSNMAEGVCLHKLVFDNNKEPVDYRIIGINKQYEQILNIADSDVVGKLASEVYNSAIPPYFEKYVEVVNKEQSFTFETYYEPLNKHFLISVSPWDIDGFATIFTDITARKQAEDVIRKERILLRTLIDNLPSTIFSKDNEGRKTLANLTDVEVIGVASESEIIGKTDLEIFSGEVGIRGYEDDMVVLQSGKPVINREEDFIDGKGIHRWLQTSKIPLFDETGKVTGLVGIGHDITERKRVDEELRKLYRAVEQSPISIVITDAQGLIEYVNPKFSELTGYSREEALGKNPNILKSGATAPENYKQLWDTIKAGGEWHGEFQNKKKNGEVYFEAALISPILDETGSITHFLATKEDITNRKRTEEEIRQKVEELAISNEELSRFNRLAIGREMRMIEIKKYCNVLASQLNIEQPYPLAFLDENKTKQEDITGHSADDVVEMNENIKTNPD